MTSPSTFLLTPEARPRSPIRMRSDRVYLRAKAVWLGMILDASRVKRLDKHALQLAKMDFENAKLELEDV